MENPIAPIRLAAALLAAGSAVMPAQTKPSNEDLQALGTEVRELRSRLAVVEARLAAYQTPTAAPVPSAAPGVVCPAGVSRTRRGPGPETPSARPAPFAFGDFT